MASGGLLGKSRFGPTAVIRRMEIVSRGPNGTPGALGNSAVDESRLSQIATQWSLIFEGTRGPDAVKAAQANLLERYCGAVYRYASRVLGDSDLAEEACQEFAYRFVRGDFRHADPFKGRFRDYVKTSVIHLLNEFRRRQNNKRALPLDGQAVGVVSDLSETNAEDAEFTAYWRKELLNRAWRELELREPADGPPSYTVLRLKAEEPNLTATVLADRLGQFGRSGYTAPAVRQLLHRARESFAALLLDEVARSIISDDPELLESELADLELLTYCRDALSKRRA
jgi:DNA-directed RNA polymerase specialized sigma24 family protein